ncbi:MAG TPA: urate hydroxylase PuuD [Burkholderiales bacterium]|nr:urate hydroxylase PuuD [Burkholderiales bacterium]
MDAALIDLGLRWAHFAAGIVWIGHNYANVAQRPRWQPLARAELVDPTNPSFLARLNREHGLFRWAAVVTWLAGMLMLARRDWLLPALTLQEGLAGNGLGAWIGTAMMLNVWLVLWPHQKKVLGFVPASVEERMRCARVTFLSSRTNTMLSIPLLFLMASSHHGALLTG